MTGTLPTRKTDFIQRWLLGPQPAPKLGSMTLSPVSSHPSVT